MGKKYSKAEKLVIVKEASEKGVKITLEKYNLYPATFYYWKKKIEEMGEIGLTHGLTKERLAIIKKLGKRRKSGRKPTCTTSQINGHGDLVKVAEETIIGANY